MTRDVTSGSARRRTFGAVGADERRHVAVASGAGDSAICRQLAVTAVLTGATGTRERDERRVVSTTTHAHQRLLENSGLPTRGLDISRTGQLADATGDFACLVFVFWPFIDVFLRMYLNIYNTSDSVSCIMST